MRQAKALPGISNEKIKAIFINDETTAQALIEYYEGKIQIYYEIPPKFQVEDDYIINVHLFVKDATEYSKILSQLKKIAPERHQVISLGYEIRFCGAVALLPKIKVGIDAIINGAAQT